ncbi:MAG: hypothetical protein AAF546_00055 [Verrucomicrobiota bacterium]
MTLRIILALFFALSAQAWQWDAELGSLRVEPLRPPYAAANLQYYNVIEDDLGRIVVAGEQISRFDGTNWDYLPESDGFYRVAIDHLGRVVAAGPTSIARWELDEAGREVRRDLPLDEVSLDFTYEMFSTEQGIYIVSFREVYLLRPDDTIRRWGFNRSQRRILPLMAAGSLHIYDRGEGLSKLVGEQWQMILPETEATSTGITSMLPTPNGDWLLSTIRGGFLSWDEKTAPVSVFEGLHSFSQDTVSGKLAGEGIYVYGTLTGFYMIDHLGRVIMNELATQKGTTEALYVDEKTKSIWVASDRGLWRVPRIQACYYPELDGRWVVDVYWRDSRIYIVTPEQTYTIEDGKVSPWSEPNYRQAWASIALDDHTVHSTLGEMTLLNRAGQAIHKVPASANIADVWPANEPNHFFKSGISELLYYEVIDDRMELLGQIELDGTLSSLRQLRNGELLGCYMGGQVVRIDSPDLWGRNPRIIEMGHKDGLSKRLSATDFGILNEHTVVAVNSDGVYRYDPREQKFRVEIDFTEVIRAADYEQTLTLCTDGSILLYQRYSQTNGEKRAGISHLKQHANGAIQKQRLNLPEVAALSGNRAVLRYRFNESGRKYVFLCSKNGLWRYDLSSHLDPPKAEARALWLSAGGRKAWQPEASTLKPIQHRDSASIKVSLLSSSETDAERYEVRLSGVDEGWYTLSKSYREYSNLRSGGYVLEYRAIDEFGRTGPVSSISFTVLPPWWQTWWAYLSYVAAGILVIWIYAKWHTRAEVRKRRQIETDLRQRLTNEEKHLLESGERLRELDAAHEALKRQLRRLVTLLQSESRGERLQAYTELMALLSWDEAPELQTLRGDVNISLASESLDNALQMVDFLDLPDTQRVALRQLLESARKSNSELARRYKREEQI